MSQARIDSTTVVSIHSRQYHGWPTLALRRNGQLLAISSADREAHICPYGRVQLMRSADAGRTWTMPETLTAGPLDDRDAGVLETKRGTLLVNWFTSLAWESILKAIDIKDPRHANFPPERVTAWRAVLAALSEEVKCRELGVWMIRSEDGGKTWSLKYDTIVNSPHGPIELADGRLLYVGKKLWTGGECWACDSTDDGRTWQHLSMIPTRPGDEVDNYHELYAVQAVDGRIVAQIRNHNKQNNGETLQCESRDGGRTWSTPHSIGVWGLPSHLLRLADGRLLMTYGHRRPPLGNQARVSNDHGQTWSDAMVISGDGKGDDLGYPSTVQVADGSLRTLWYEVLKDQPMAVLRMATWRLG